MKTYDNSPYYDDYDEAKDYVQLLCVAGNYAQSREFTQMGTIYRDYLERLGNAIFSNGTVLTGCDIVISDKTVTMQEGSVYLEGLVRKIRRPLTIDISGEGEEVIGLKIEESIVTAVQDISLRNPAVGTEGYNQEGSHRVKQKVVITVNDPDAASLYKLVNGTLYTEVATTTNEDNTELMITDVLARRTYDVSGSFKVEGLDITNKDTDDGTSAVFIGSGKAYIKGYEVVLQNMFAMECEIPTTFRTCNNEPKTFMTVSDKFYFNNNPLKCVNQLTSKVKVTREVTRGSIAGGRDMLPDQPVESIERIVAGSVEYVQGTDYQLTGNYVDWSLFGDEPATGRTYEVTYCYMRTNVEGTDYEVLGSGENKYIQFLASGNVPIANTQILIDYDFYLSRIDMYLIDKDANITVIKGVPDKSEFVEAPINGDSSLLILGNVLNYANSTRKLIANEHTVRLTQADLYNLKKRIDDIEYNQAVDNLDREAKEGEDASELKGILTDGFLGFTKCDISHPEFDGSVDVDVQEFTVGCDTEVISLNVDKDATDTSAGIVGRVLMAPYREVVCLTQPKATKKFLVNPYAVYGKTSLITLDPAVDNWIDNKEITINETNTKSATLRRWWYHTGESWAAAEKAKWLALTGTTGSQLGWSNYNGVSTSVTTSVKAEAITYMRNRVIKITGSNFEPDEDNIEVTFNGAKVTPRNPSAQGATTGTIKANSLGRVTCEIDVPEKTPCGSVEVKLEGPISKGTATYTAEGTKVTTTKKVLTTRVIVNSYDPLAQTFQFDRDTIIMGLDLFFAGKDSKRACIVQIRDVVNGYPGTTCFAEKTIIPEEITVNGDRPVATHITFPQPVWCEQDTQYCFVVLSDSNVYQIWVAEMGETDVVTKSPVTTQPFVEGVMFSSSNGLSWTAHQMADITFNLYKAEYTGTGVIVFEGVSQLDFDRILLAAETEDHKNAGIEWWYRINGSTVWSSIETFTDRDVEEIGRTFDLRANLKIAQSTSPMIAGDCMNLVYFKNHTKATYISRQVEMTENFTNIKVDTQFALPAGCTAKVYYMTADQSQEWVLMDNPTVTQENAEFNRFVYTVTGISAKFFRVKVELETVNPLVRPRMRKLMCIMKY